MLPNTIVWFCLDKAPTFQNRKKNLNYYTSSYYHRWNYVLDFFEVVVFNQYFPPFPYDHVPLNKNKALMTESAPAVPRNMTITVFDHGFTS